MYEHFFKEIEEEMAKQSGKEEVVKKLLDLGDYSPEKISEIAEVPMERVLALMN